MKSAIFTVLTLVLLTATVAAQDLDGSPYNPETEPAIDMFIVDWHDSMPVSTHGTLIERPIFTPGKNPDPVRKGAVLEFCNRFSHAVLSPRSATTPVTLKGEQEIFYVLDGTGTVTGAGETLDLGPGYAVLVPAGLEFTLRNTGAADLAMYLLCEPIPAGFRPNAKLFVKNAGEVAFSPTLAHWSHIDSFLFKPADGLGTLELVETCTFSPMTIGGPHSHGPQTEESWTVIRGKNVAMLGKQIRNQGPGVAYLIPNDGKTPHSNINATDDLLTFFYFARYRDHEVRP